MSVALEDMEPKSKNGVSSVTYKILIIKKVEKEKSNEEESEVKESTDDPLNLSTVMSSIQNLGTDKQTYDFSQIWDSIKKFQKEYYNI